MNTGVTEEVGNLIFGEEKYFDIVWDTRIKFRLQSCKPSTTVSITIVETSTLASKITTSPHIVPTKSRKADTKAILF